MKRPIPTFKTNKEAEVFVETADLSAYDLTAGQIVRFELKGKDKPVTLRLPSESLDAVRARAERAGMRYQRFIRIALERAVQEPKSSACLALASRRASPR
jgi:predicted DNA binding CopG/RHH family protein